MKTDFFPAFRIYDLSQIYLSVNVDFNVCTVPAAYDCCCYRMFVKRYVKFVLGAFVIIVNTVVVVVVCPRPDYLLNLIFQHVTF